MRNAALTIAAGLGVGLGLSSTVQPAFACKCASESVWRLQRVSVVGDGDLAAEQAYWPDELTLSNPGAQQQLYGSEDHTEYFSLEAGA